MNAALVRVTPGRVAKEGRLPMPSHLTPHQRFWSKVDKNGSVPDFAPHLGRCWLWTAHRSAEGYGRFWDGGRDVQAHRWAYEEARGLIPIGLQPDHLCRNRGCVNSRHIEVVTGRVNVLRGVGPSARAAVATHCPSGHPYSVKNTKVYRGHRYCRTCHNEWNTQYHERPEVKRRRADKARERYHLRTAGGR